MTLEQYGAIGELIGGVAVLVTVVYLAIQVRSLKKEMHLNSYMDQTESYNGILQSMSADLARVLAKAEDDFTSLERWEWFLLEGHLASWLNSTELAIRLIDTGSLEGEIEEKSIAGLFFSRPGAHEFWDQYKDSYPESLRTTLEKYRDGT